MINFGSCHVLGLLAKVIIESIVLTTLPIIMQCFLLLPAEAVENESEEDQYGHAGANGGSNDRELGLAVTCFEPITDFGQLSLLVSGELSLEQCLLGGLLLGNLLFGLGVYFGAAAWDDFAFFVGAFLFTCC